jgi:hypothetical protein
MRRSVFSVRTVKPRTISVVLACLLLFGVGYSWFKPASGAQLGPRAIQLSANTVSAAATYQLTFEVSTAGSLGSIVAQFCSNTALEADPCVAPTGFDISSATLVDQTGPGDFTVGSGTTANQLELTHTPANITATTSIRFELTGVTNPDTAGSYFVRLQTYATDDGSGPSSDYGGIAFAITNDLSISAQVPPYLLFCTAITIPGLNCANASGDYIDFGELSSKHASSGSSQFLVGTNAENGYNVTVNGTTMTSGANVINNLTSADVSRPGTPQFGFNLRANSTPPTGRDVTGPGLSTPQPDYDQANFFRFNPGDTLVIHPTPDDLREYTAAYIVNVPTTQAAGVYVSTLTYICLGDF